MSTKTLQRWDASGKLKAYRTPTDRRYYTEEQYLQYIGDTAPDKDSRLDVMYTRVSNKNQKDDLLNQQNFIRDFVNAQGIIIDREYTDVGSGLNYKRRQWNELLEDVMKNRIKKVYITYEDRFVRFGYDWFVSLLGKFNTEIIVLNNRQLSPEQELVEDLISIIHVFSCRIYGLRKYKKVIKDDKEL